MQNVIDKPPLTLITGAAGAGKTEWALRTVGEANGGALLLVPTERQSERFAQELSIRTNLQTDIARSKVKRISSFASDLCGDEKRLISRPLQLMILNELIQSQILDGDYLYSMKESQGFVAELADRIHEWKLFAITPESLENLSINIKAEKGELSAVCKLKEFARIFQRYESFLLQHRYCDKEDRYLLAAARLASDEIRLPEDITGVIVDGFYRLYPVQIEFLQELAISLKRIRGKFPFLGITLPYEPDRSLLFSLSEQTRESLHSRFLVEENPVEPHITLDTIQILRASLFGTRKESVALEEGHPPVLLLEAPNAYMEVEMVAREFLKIHEDVNCSWNDFAVIMRSLGPYSPIISSVFERYHIPVLTDGPEQVINNPIVKTMLHILSVVRYGWQREDIFSVLKSSYTLPSRIETDLLRRMASRRGIRSGRDEWINLSLGERNFSRITASLNWIAEADTALMSKNATPASMADTIHDLFERLDQQRETGELVQQNRDKRALEAALEALHALPMVFELYEQENFSFHLFFERLLSAWGRETVRVDTKEESVRLLDPYSSRDYPVRTAAVIGLTEKVFPRQTTEDPFLRDEERLAFAEQSGTVLPLQRDRADEERLLFYLSVTTPSERVILSYPRSGDNSDSLPSFYLDDVRESLSHNANKGDRTLKTKVRNLSDVAPREEDAETFHDRLLGACADYYDPIRADKNSSELLEKARLRMKGLEDEYCRDVTIEVIKKSRNLPPWPRILQSDLLAELSSRKTAYSVSELETYARCPFQYLMQYVLKLSIDSTGIDSRLQGQIFHKILRTGYSEKFHDDSFNLKERVLALLEEELRVLKSDAPPHQLELLRRSLTEALSKTVRREEIFGTIFAMDPTYFELAFGLGNAPEGFQNDEERENNDQTRNNLMFDHASVGRTLTLISTESGESAELCGVIDRVDVDGNGLAALAVDYKLGKPPEWKQIERGVSLQMPIYLMALESLFGKIGAAACYDSAREGGRRRFYRQDHLDVRRFKPVLPHEDGSQVTALNSEKYAALTTSTANQAVQLVQRLRSGDIAPRAGEHCSYCEFADVCRTTIQFGHDGEPAPIEMNREL